MFACGDDSDRASRDAATDPIPTDSGPARPDAAVCEPACASGDLCCPDSDGAAECIDPRTSMQHCGRCDLVCTPERGDSCEQGFCACGLVREGCLGTQRDTCCTDGAGMRTCRNLDTDVAHCGTCGSACDPRRANGCRNGVCECGDLRAACPGTPEATCCNSALGADCFDLRTSRAHCGACGFACPFGFRCLDGICSLEGMECTPRCTFPDVCCRGECCDVTFCRDDGCTSV
jgi:hypothetical protein